MIKPIILKPKKDLKKRDIKNNMINIMKKRNQL